MRTVRDAALVFERLADVERSPVDRARAAYFRGDIDVVELERWIGLAVEEEWNDSSIPCVAF